MTSAFVRFTRLDRLERREGVSDRAVTLSFLARFFDEVLSGAWTVLTPTFRRVFDLSLVQVGLLSQVLAWVALVVEPPAATSIDLRSRRVLVAFGGIAVAASTLMMGLAPTYPLLLAAFAVYGVGSGPLAHTADVIVVEAFPDAPERAFNRATFLDTVGALVGPGVVAVGAAVGVSWRWLLVGLGASALLYAIALSNTTFPAPPGSSEDGPLVRQLLRNIGKVVRHAEARRALLVLFLFDLFEAAFVLKYVWLDEERGLSQATVAAYAAVEQVVDLAALLWLDRWLARRDGGSILRLASCALVVLPLVWVATPTLLATIAVGIPLAAMHALVWPLARARSLVVVPELAGAASAVTTLFPVLPLSLAVSWLAEVVGIGTAMAGTAAVGAGLMALVTATSREPRSPSSPGDDRSPA